MKNPSTTFTQFARLIAEIETVGGFTRELFGDLKHETDMTTEDIVEIIDEAQRVWDTVKKETICD